ncbi:MAG TPA: hypothetical protein VFU76_14090 [Terriglobales bacterium]|nr:hypothetical protein [Terriglobales bacterium]
MSPGIILAAATVVALVVMVVRLSLRGRRAKELQRAAAARGMSFEACGQPFGEAEMEQILRFTRRRGHRCHFVARGNVNGEEVIFFEHLARNGGRESVAAFRLAAPDFELIRLRHAVNPAVMAPVFSRLGFAVVNFEGDANFSREYLLIGRDEGALRHLFNDTLRSFYCVPQGERHWASEAGAGWLLVFRADRMIRPGDLGKFLDEAALVATAVRREVNNVAAVG